MANEKIITSFSLDTSDLKAAGEKRKFEISGDNGAVFSLEIKNGTTYYNFQTNLFQATETKLSDITIGTSSYTGSIAFPKVAAGAQYDVFLFSIRQLIFYRKVVLPLYTRHLNTTTNNITMLNQFTNWPIED